MVEAGFLAGLGVMGMGVLYGASLLVVGRLIDCVLAIHRDTRAILERLAPPAEA